MESGDGVNLQRVWKEFGKHTEAGKLLYNIYGVKYKPEDHIHYPKLLLKTPEMKEKERLEKEKLKKEKENKVTKAANKIDYMSGLRQYPKKNYYNPYGAVDYMPHRRNEYQIKREMNQMKKQMSQNVKTNLRPGINRQEQIEKLQDKFEFMERKVMPKGARLPALKIDDNTFKNNCNNNIDNDNAHNDDYYDKNDKRAELEYLYKKIVGEIDERYKFMSEMKALGKNVDNEIMAEIKERINEMKTLQKLIEDYDKKNNIK